MKPMIIAPAALALGTIGLLLVYEASTWLHLAWVMATDK